VLTRKDQPKKILLHSISLVVVNFFGKPSCTRESLYTVKPGITVLD